MCPYRSCGRFRDSRPSGSATRGLLVVCWLALALAAPPATAAASDAPRAEDVASASEAEAPTSPGLAGDLDRTSQILTFALIGGAVAVLESADTETVENIGDVLQLALPAAALASTFVARDPQGRRRYWRSLGVSTVTVALLKETLEKARPNARGLNSFPSGHTAAAFTGAGFFNLRYGARWGAPALVLAGYTGASRVYAEKHFLDDVISGMSIGLLANRYHVFPIDEDLAVVPLVDDDATGVAVRYKGSLELWKERSFDAEDRPPPRGFRYEWEFGGTHIDVNELATGGSAPISYLFDEANNPTVTGRVEIGYVLDDEERQQIVAQIAPLDVRDFGMFASDTVFAGTLVPGGEPLRTRYLLYDYRLRYRHRLSAAGRFRSHVGAGISFQDIVGTIDWPAGEADIEEGNWIPFAHLDGEVALNANRRLRLLAEVDAGRSAEDRSLDAALMLRYEIHPRWDLSVGSRLVERTIETDLLRNRLERDQYVVAVAHRF